jgi:hypothetical protein
MTTTKHITAARLTTVRRTLTSGLTAIAFFNSFSHTAAWFADNGQAAAAPLLAAIPEVAIILVVLTLAQGGMSKATTGIISAIGFGSVAITITANLAGAAPGLAGVAAALVAPVFAILGFGLEFTSIVKVAPARKAPAKRSSKAPVAEKAPVTAKKKNRGVIDQGILWASALPTWPSIEEIQEQFPAINRNTASRIHNSRASKASV